MDPMNVPSPVPTSPLLYPPLATMVGLDGVVPLFRFSQAAAIAAVAWATYLAGLGMLGGAVFAKNPVLGVMLGFALSFLVGGVVELLRRRRHGSRIKGCRGCTPLVSAHSRNGTIFPSRRGA